MEISLFIVFLALLPLPFMLRRLNEIDRMADNIAKLLRIIRNQEETERRSGGRD